MISFAPMAFIIIVVIVIVERYVDGHSLFVLMKVKGEHCGVMHDDEP